MTPRDPNVRRSVEAAPVTLGEQAEYAAELAIPRPRTRAECKGAPRPCPWVGCRYHLGLDVTDAGRLKLPVGMEPWEVEQTCALDVADEVGAADLGWDGRERGWTGGYDDEGDGGPRPGSLDHIGRLLGLTGEAVRVVQESAFDHARQTEAGREVLHALAAGALREGPACPAAPYVPDYTTIPAPEGPDDDEITEETMRHPWPKCGIDGCERPALAAKRGGRGRLAGDPLRWCEEHRRDGKAQSRQRAADRTRAQGPRNRTDEVIAALYGARCEEIEVDRLPAWFVVACANVLSNAA